MKVIRYINGIKTDGQGLKDRMVKNETISKTISMVNKRISDYQGEAFTQNRG